MKKGLCKALRVLMKPQSPYTEVTWKAPMNFMKPLQRSDFAEPPYKRGIVKPLGASYTHMHFPVFFPMDIRVLDKIPRGCVQPL